MCLCVCVRVWEKQRRRDVFVCMCVCFLNCSCYKHILTRSQKTPRHFAYLNEFKINYAFSITLVQPHNLILGHFPHKDAIKLQKSKQYNSKCQSMNLFETMVSREYEQISHREARQVSRFRPMSRMTAKPTTIALAPAPPPLLVHRQGCPQEPVGAGFHVLTTED